jgi:hypothetical protein
VDYGNASLNLLNVAELNELRVLEISQRFQINQHYLRSSGKAMTRKKLIILLGVFIVLCLIGRTVYKIISFTSKLGEERERYAGALLYNVSSRVDSIKLIAPTGGPGKIYCTVTKGNIDYSIEDSLAKTLVYHSSLRFNEIHTTGALRFVTPGAERWKTGDSVVINAPLNQLSFFRDGNQIYVDQLSNLLEGRITDGL